MTIEPIPDPLYAAPLFSMNGEAMQLHFHLNFHNRRARPLALRRISLSFSREGQLLSRIVLTTALLERRLRPVPWIVMRDRQTISAANRLRGQLDRVAGDTVIPPGQSVSLTHQLSLFRLTELPDQIHCLVEHEVGQTQRSWSVETYQQQTVLRLPIKERWWVMASYHFDEDHNSAVLLSQNFALDLGRLGNNLSTYRGEILKNSSYFAYGQQVVAAADGEVVVVSDTLDDNEPVGSRPSLQEILRRPQDLAGNYVVVQHTADEFSAYLHLKPGILVRRGMRVQSGQPIGYCGNSGNSLESHLHFQLQDSADILHANGLPARFSDFTFHLGHLSYHVPSDASIPLPSRLLVEPGCSSGAKTLPWHLLKMTGQQ